MITDLRNTDFVSFHIKPSITDETWGWIKTTLGLSVEAGTLTSDGFVSCVDLGFVRTSDGDRYNKNIHPSIEDKVVSVPGGDGNYYFGMFWKDQEFSIPIAYDDMSEIQLRAITTLFAGDRKMWDIYFDEAPYKVYHVKMTSPITLRYICMNDASSSTSSANLVHNHNLGQDMPVSVTYGARKYKGEGTITLKAFSPFAKQRFKYLNSYTELNKDEWSAASRLLSTQGSYDIFSSGICPIWNAGDLSSDWTLIYEVNSQVPTVTISNYSDNQSGSIIIDDDGGQHKLVIKNLVLKGNDTHIRINTSLNLLEGGTLSEGNFVPSGNVYDKYKTSGKYFKLNPGQSYFYFPDSIIPQSFVYDYKYY